LQAFWSRRRRGIAASVADDALQQRIYLVLRELLFISH
jgi:hypothetical protein